MSQRTRRNPRVGLHPDGQVVPALFCERDVFGRRLLDVFSEGVKQHSELAKAPVQHAVEFAAVVTAQLSQAAANV